MCIYFSKKKKVASRSQNSLDACLSYTFKLRLKILLKKKKKKREEEEEEEEATAKDNNKKLPTIDLFHKCFQPRDVSSTKRCNPVAQVHE